MKGPLRPDQELHGARSGPVAVWEDGARSQRGRPAIEQAHTHKAGSTSTQGYLDLLNVPAMPARSSPFDPGYDPVTLESHLDQSAHLISILKMSMASWIVAREEATRRKLAAARGRGVPTVAGGTPFEIAVVHGLLPHYLELCAGLGFTRIEAGHSLLPEPPDPGRTVSLAREHGLDVQFELGGKHDGGFTRATVEALVDTGRRWLDAGALQLVIEARESARRVGLFGDRGEFHGGLADRFAEAFGLDAVVFEAPTKSSQFAFLDRFGASVRLANIRLEELLRVEIYRRGLHSDAFLRDNLRPARRPRGESEPS
jgi:phosphosulfolactate synthase